jgi:hypothetical protein
LADFVRLAAHAIVAATVVRIGRRAGVDAGH